MRNSTKGGKARFHEADVRNAIQDAASIAGSLTSPAAGSRSSAVNVRRATGKDRNAKFDIDPAVTAVKRVATARILNTDRDAMHKLQQRLAAQLALMDNMERTNEFVANQDREGLLRYGYSAEGVEELFLFGPGQTPGFSVQELANAALDIERTRDRIATLETNLNRPTKIEQEHGYEYREDAGEQRVMFAFPRKPAITVRQLLGQSGFRWSVTRSAWQRPLSDNSIEAAERVRRTLADLPNIFEQKSKITLH